MLFTSRYVNWVTGQQLLLQQGIQEQQHPGHLSKHCSKIKNIIAIARQGQEVINNT